MTQPDGRNLGANAASVSPLFLLQNSQAAARKEYERAKADRDQAQADLDRAGQVMKIWDDQLHEFQVAIDAISRVATP
jgi:hypothetical protein